MLKTELFNAEIQMKKLAALTGVMLMAAAEAMAQDKAAKPARRIVVSLPDRKLAVMEAGRVVKIFPTPVGAPKSLFDADGDLGRLDEHRRLLTGLQAEFLGLGL